MNIPSSFAILEFQSESSAVIEEYSLETKVCVGLTAPVLVLIIFFMNWSIVYYENFGHDPQKRNLSNMMLSSFCMVLGTGIIISLVLVSIRIIFGPFDASNSFAFLVILKLHLNFNHFCLMEVGIYKVLAKYFPKAIIGINDDWCHCFFICLNFMMSFIISITTSWDITLWTPLVKYGYVLGVFISFLIGQEQFINYEL